MTNKNFLPVGSVLNSGTSQYRVLKVLGAGGFGITYLVVSPRKIGNITVNVRFAIKEHFLSEYCERDSDTLRIITGLGKHRETVDNSMKDFLGEVRRLQQVGNGSPSIVKVNEVFEANGTAYYVMEYLEGKSLRNYVLEHGPLSESETLRLLTPIAEAVDYIHSCQMTHLDIKPDNIILAEEEGPDGNTVIRPVLIDFGLSKHYDDSGNATSTINILGCSDGYAPIEQYAGISKYSPEADIYSLAATMLFCLTGKNPQKSTDLIYVNISDYISQSVPSISPELHSALKQALSPIPANRPDSLAGFSVESRDNVSADKITPPIITSEPAVEPEEPVNQTELLDGNNNGRKLIRRYLLIGFIAALLIPGFLWLFSDGNSKSDASSAIADSTLIDEDTQNILYAVPSVENIDNPVQEKKEDAVKVDENANAVNRDSKIVPPEDRSKITSGKINGHEWVNLGLLSGLKWATMNVGATSPSDYGSYFAWGETHPKAEYTKSNSRTWEQNYGDIGGNAEFDAARANWGGSWRLPTKAECEELINKCTWTRTTIGNHKGYKVVGPNGNHIFLPAAGYRIGSPLCNAGLSVYYWTSSPCSSSHDGYALCFSRNGSLGIGDYYCYYGLSVRPVSE